MRMILTALLPIAAFAQVGAPFIGLVPDGSHLREMYGLPAAGAIGSMIVSRDFSHIAILAPSQYGAVVSAADTGEVFVATEVSAGGFALTPVPGATANPDSIVTSPEGTSAALWYGLSHQLQIATALATSPATRSIDASLLNVSPLALAVSDDGQWAAGIWPSGVYAFGPNGQMVNLQTDPGVVALAFFHNGHGLAFASASRATSIQDVGGNTGATVLYDYSQQSISPRAIALSSDNSRAVVADASGKIVNITIASGAANTIDCGCSPTGLYGLGDALFRLNGIRQTLVEQIGVVTRPHTTAAELKLFDASTGAVWIVPPALNLTGGRQ